MNNHVTVHYQRSQEKLIAEFHTAVDAIIFLTKKMATDKMLAPKLIYRLYHDSELISEYNPEQITISQAQYTDMDHDFINLDSFLFEVTLQRLDTSEKKCIASFNDINDANLFLIAKCEADQNIHDHDLLCILKNHVLIKTFSKTIMIGEKIKHEVSNNQQSNQVFHPTPVPTRPIPTGGPIDCWIEKEDDNH